MKVLFQKPRWATATFSVSAAAVCATAIAISPLSKADSLLTTFSTNSLAQQRPPAARGPDLAPAQSSLIFFSRTMRPQRASSSLNIFPNSALAVGAGTAPDCKSFSRTSGVSSTATTASCNFATTADGVFAGANNPYQLSATVSGETLLGERGDVGQQRVAAGGGGADRLELAGANMRQQHRRIGEQRGDLPAEKIRQGRRGAAIGHVQKLHVRSRLIELEREMCRATRTGRGERDRPGLLRGQRG